MKGPNSSAVTACSEHRIAWPQDLIRRYNVSGPRYTSYPTALSFRDLSPDEAARIMGHSDPTAPLSLYVHIPFCRHLCYYCACNKVVTRDHSRADAYLDALEEEMQLAATWHRQRPVTQLHWGGGTPTFLTDAQTDRLCDLLEQYFDLDADPERREFSIEVDPRVTSVDRLEQLYKRGFNRLSLGVQDFNLETQEAVHRIQPFGMVSDLVDAAREIGYRSINFDLIYGLPLQTVKRFHATLEKVIALRPDRIACYSYAHLPSRFSPQRRLITSDLPEAETKLSILQDTVNTLQDAGYFYIGMDHFALPEDELAKAWHDGSLQRNFQGYSTQAETELLALGVSAISQLGNAYLQNHKDLGDYQASVEAGTPAVRGYQMTRDDEIRRHVIMRLACQNAVQLSEMERLFGINVRLYFAREWPVLLELESDGLLKLETDHIRVTDIGRLLLRPICMVFDAHLSDTPSNRFSRVM
ncbi:MAG: oxygen-independent coproporphyrinogen III oxidase [Natronospirillum sp.]|uniref:oxygen-independent coproporphyrinogen III oxidase n=1 Tax=Natronospirillum sp. TaxID=2812955 RepID=UPI0025FB57D9|nr:oxygen-independent coproporphyrinogen III oxidase [Natronospirillum sp.]MCH8552279.1 oxygen-independent coproporphyrinogen III oxidase [Natronospirillum sp.]